MLSSNEILQGNFARTQGFSASHNGTDWGCPNGTPVKSRRSGIVKVTGTNPVGKDFGNYIRVYSPSVNLSSWYAHLQSFNCSVGQNVTAGQVIAFSNNTGISTGAHLHYGESTGESLNWINPDTTGGEDMNTPETNEILYKTVLGRFQGTAGDAGASSNVNKPIDEVINFMWNTDEAKNFQSWLSTVRDQFPKLQETIGQLQTSLSQQTLEIDSLDQKVNGQGKIIDEQEQKITDLQKELVSCTTKPEKVCPEGSQGLPKPTFGSILADINTLIRQWLKI